MAKKHLLYLIKQDSLAFSCQPRKGTVQLSVTQSIAAAEPLKNRAPPKPHAGMTSYAITTCGMPLVSSSSPVGFAASCEAPRPAEKQGKVASPQFLLAGRKHASYKPLKLRETRPNLHLTTRWRARGAGAGVFLLFANIPSYQGEAKDFLKLLVLFLFVFFHLAAHLSPSLCHSRRVSQAGQTGTPKPAWAGWEVLPSQWGSWTSFSPGEGVRRAPSSHSPARYIDDLYKYPEAALTPPGAE